jgi:HEAT repeat protein
MSNYKLALIVAVLVIVGGALGLELRGGRRPPEPIYAGKRLTVWLANESIDRAMVNGIGLTDEAADAVRAIGTNAIPYLLATLESSGTNAKSIMDRHRAATGFRALGPEAQSAYPTLVGLALNSTDYGVRCDAINALMLADEKAITLLAQALGNPDRAIRARAALALYFDRRAPTIAMPALTEALNDPEATVRANAVRALGAYQERARPLAPRITALLNDPDNAVKNGAAEALRFINPKLQ